MVTGFVTGLLRPIRLMGLAGLSACFLEGKIGMWGGTVNGGEVRVEMILISR